MDARKYLELKFKGRRGVGEMILSAHLSSLDDVLSKSRNVIHSAFRWDVTDDVKMTSLLDRLGLTAGHSLKLELSDDDRIQVGRAIFEAFMNGEEIVRIERKFTRTPKRDGVWQDNPYLVFLTEKGQESVNRIKPVFCSDSPIPDVSSTMHPNGLPLMHLRNPVKDSVFQEHFLDAPFVQAANVLQQTGWTVNAKVLEAVCEQWGKFRPDKLPSLRQGNKDERKAAQRVHSKAHAADTIRRKASALSGSPFYQYVYFDFRGRVYYYEPFFNFQGTDLARGLMKFDEAKRIGEDGLYWLAVHTANSYNCSFGIDEIPEYFEYDYRSHLESEGLTDISLDKMTLDDRVRWVNENMDQILLTGFLGGLPDCEKPVSFLAACLEWVEIDKLSDPTWYFCSLPIGVDGSNNGWQHLGAMLKDDVTGSLVGLTVQEIPNDLYVKVARELVDIYGDWFEERGMPMKAIRKGIAKRGTMTKAYSAGRATMAENMWNDIYQYGYDVKYGITEADCQWLSAELIEAINTVCPKPMEAMKTLQRIASCVVQGEGDVIRWLTPAGFPVDQEYVHSNQRDVRLTFSPPRTVGGFAKQITAVLRKDTKHPDHRQHQNSISPNFVHSQDAAHLSLTVANWGGSFGAVHDSFSVHASDVEDLLDLTKSVFVEMYDEPNFLAQLAGDLGTNVETPELGGLEVEEVINSDFFFA